jgi:hypothetical protein
MNHKIILIFIFVITLGLFIGYLFFNKNSDIPLNNTPNSSYNSSIPIIKTDDTNKNTSGTLKDDGKSGESTKPGESSESGESTKPGGSSESGETPESEAKSKQSYKDYQKEVDDLKEKIEREKLEEEKKLEQEKLNVKIRVCGKDLIPPCSNGYIATDVLDPVTEKNISCCLIDPNRNDPTKIQQALKVAEALAKNIGINMGLEYSIVVSKKLLGRVGIKVSTKGIGTSLKSLTTKIGAKMISGTSSLSKVGAKILPKTINKVIAKSVIKIGQNFGIKFGIKIGAKIGAMGAKMGAKLGMGPVGWALMAFDIFSLGLDAADPGGYETGTFLGEFIENRDKTKDAFINEIKKQGGTYPIIVGPLNKLPSKSTLSEEEQQNYLNSIIESLQQDKEVDIPATQEDYSKFIIIEYCLSYLESKIEGLDLSDLSEAEIEVVISTIFDNGTLFFDTNEGETFLLQRLCEMVDGKFDNGICTYKDKESCNASYDWNKVKESIEKNIETNEVYVEYKDGKCVMENPALRIICEDKKLEYDDEKQLCKITDEYCARYGVDTINTNNGKDCKLKVGQEIAEFIFGTTITRGLRQVFDPDQYKPCNQGDYDGNSLPSELKTTIYASIALLPPLNYPGILYATLGNKACITPYKCTDPLINEGGLCYPKCKDGFKSDGATLCYKQYPEFENNGKLHTITNITKDIKTNTGRPLSYCDPDKEKGGAICYPKCKDGYKSDAATICYKDTPPNWPGTTSITHLQHKTNYDGPGTPLTECNPDQDKDGALCYPKCKSGFSGKGPVCWGSCPSNTVDVGALCRDTCRVGHYEVAGVCWENTPTNMVDVGALLREKCKEGYNEVAGVCWENTPANMVDVGALLREKCKPGFNDKGGVCWEDTPSGYTDVGTLVREGCKPGYKDVAGVCWATGCPGGWSDDGATCREPISCKDDGYYNYTWGCGTLIAKCWNGSMGCKGDCYRTWIVKPSCSGGTVKGKDTYIPTTRAKQSYVPTTRARQSYVPTTRDRKSYVPPTNPKPSYGRGAGEPLKCPSGKEQRGALCYNDCKRFNANGIEYERRNDNIDMCSTKCPPGFTNVGIGGCQRDSYNRGIGEPMKCKPGELEKSKGLCYDACPTGYQDQSLGLCSQACPPESTDMGVGCIRNSYNRGAGTLPFRVYVKERKVPYGTKKN